MTATASATRWSAAVGDHVTGLAWSPDGAQLAACCGEGQLHVLDAATGESAWTAAADPLGTLAVTWSEVGLVTGGQDGHARFWTEGRETLAIKAGRTWVEQVAWSPDGTHLATASGRELRVWMPDGSVAFERTDFSSTISAIQWRPDGKAIGAACYGGVRLFRLAESEPYEDLAWKGSVLSLAWSPNARYVAAGSQEASINFWKLPHREGEQLQMSGYATKVRELAWDGGSRYLATGGGPIVTVWDVSGKGPSGTRPRQLDLHLANVMVLAYQPNGLLLASGDAEGLAALWNPAKSEKPLRADRLRGSISCAAWSPRGTSLALASADGEIVVWEVSAR